MHHIATLLERKTRSLRASFCHCATKGLAINTGPALRPQRAALALVLHNVLLWFSADREE